MNILVYPHQMVVGGSQINALEIAARIRDRGHAVTIVAPDGPLVPMIKQLGLDYVRTASDSDEVSLRTAFQLLDLVQRLNIDVIHAYEWRPALEASFVPHLLRGVPLVVTVLSMGVPGYIPRHLPLIVGTAEIASDMRLKGRKQVEVIEPPVDLDLNRPGDVAAARARWSFAREEVVISVVCRMTTDLQKLEGVLQAIDAVSGLADVPPCRFLVVGGGQGLEAVQAKAGAINRRAGRELVLVTGAMNDPRPAYEASDIVLGMGSSALRGLAFAKPLVVQGANGFWKLLDHCSADAFLWQGFYGDGGKGTGDLQLILSDLVASPHRRATLGKFGRQLVEQKFSLDCATTKAMSILETAARKPRPLSSVAPIARAAGLYGKSLLHALHRHLLSA
ncbi:Glycosyltransferase involved in cell wall bisynthesis [Devosia crocina]|uniref:Glycosyltransferase involved in cell wall bisynthesis n=1 Tax=Devosia crocina TaxID=429728 RepID=A0A1I7MZ13_9HYPH|nr:glycosyltransferase [Devosia crocina]SFV27642.1 Glycosyltransferase involved in cell wall bisynthesis [Devosia crocina]